MSDVGGDPPVELPPRKNVLVWYPAAMIANVLGSLKKKAPKARAPARANKAKPKPTPKPKPKAAAAPAARRASPTAGRGRASASATSSLALDRMTDQMRAQHQLAVVEVPSLRSKRVPSARVQQQQRGGDSCIDSAGTAGALSLASAQNGQFAAGIPFAAANPLPHNAVLNSVVLSSAEVRGVDPVNFPSGVTLASSYTSGLASVVGGAGHPGRPGHPGGRAAAASRRR